MPLNDTQSKAKELLQGVRELLSDEAQWTQGCFARTPCKVKVEPLHAEASCWCVMGATYKVLGERRLDQLEKLRAGAMSPEGAREVLYETPARNYLLEVLCTALYDNGYARSIPNFNDTHDHAEVMAWLDRTLANWEDLCANT